MTDNLLDPTTQEPEPVQHDRSPEAGAGSDPGSADRQPQAEPGRTAYDVQEAHRQLVDWSDDDLKQVPLLPAGARLEHGATYVDLREPARREFTATGEMQVPIDGLYVPRTEVDDRTWSRLLGLRTSERVVQASGTTG